MGRFVEKSKGMGQYIEFTVVLAAMLSIIWYQMSLAADMERSREIYAIIREYSLKMESRGCLTEEEKEGLILKLEMQGMTDIVFPVNPLLQVEYGAEVALSVTGTVPVSNIIAYKDFKFVRDGNSIRFTRTIKSTAQY